MRTRITDLFGVRHPIVQGRMHYLGLVELTAAISSAGGLGMLTGLTQQTPKQLANDIARCRAMTILPFGMNFTFLPAGPQRESMDYVHAIVESGIKIVETSGENPSISVAMLKAAGLSVIYRCSSIKQALTAEQLGCDAISIDGFDCDGHPGEDEVPNFALLPAAAAALDVPFIVSGGMANGCSLVAALALGANGIAMDTRFLATREAPVDDSVKQAILRASARIMNPRRIMNRGSSPSKIATPLQAENRAATGLTADGTYDYGANFRPPATKDDLAACKIVECGPAPGPNHDVPTVQSLVDQIMVQASHLISEDLPRLNSGFGDETPDKGEAA